MLVFLSLLCFLTVSSSNIQPTSFFKCSELNVTHIDCELCANCRFGLPATANCSVKPDVQCSGPRNFTRSYTCTYCYLLDPKYHICSSAQECSSFSNVKHEFFCSVDPEILCLGTRSFKKAMKCNFTAKKSFSMALTLSLILGGFGVDRFYLGYIGFGVLKFFTAGGFGIWTLFDAIQIATGYLTPADGSLFVE